MTLEERWEQFDDEYIKFDRIEKKRNQRPDLHAFLLLDELCPNHGKDMVSAAEVRFDSEYDCLAMFA